MYIKFINLQTVTDASSIPQAYPFVSISADGFLKRLLRTRRGHNSEDREEMRRETAVRARSANPPDKKLYGRTRFFSIHKFAI
jgi:hypothetical protein